MKQMKMTAKHMRVKADTHRKQLRSKAPTVSKKKKKQANDVSRNRRGPRLPSSLRRQLDLLNPKPENSEEVIDSDEADDERTERNDVYEYDEPIPEEESKKNRRFDSVDNLEYELPEDFEDENVSSSSDNDNDEDERAHKAESVSDISEAEAEEDDEERHSRLLQGITGMPSEAFQGKKRKNGVLSELPPESEYNLPNEASDGPITIQDLLDPLHGKPGYSKLRKKMYQLEKGSLTLQAPLPKIEQEKLERKVAYVKTKKEMTKWEQLVKKNREAPTVFFDEDTDVGYSTVGAIASEFEPRTEFEKKINSLVHDPEVVEAYENDGARLLEFNMVSVEDVKERQNRLAKMRSLLFRHETKAKHIKKIKSKTYHRMLKKERLKAASTQVDMDPEAAKELSMKQEFKRAEERMTLKHKNSSKWAKRILKRGMDKQDEATRAAIAEQLHLNTSLTRKMRSMNDGSGSDGSSDPDDDDDDDEDFSGSDGERTSNIINRAKEKTQQVIEEEDEIPKSGVLSLPFMVRGLKKRNEASRAEAERALEEYDAQLRNLEDESGGESLGASSGKRVFGMAMRSHVKANNATESVKYGQDSESEDLEGEEHIDLLCKKNVALQKDVQVDPGILLEESDGGHDTVFKSFEDIVKNPGPKSEYEVAIFASDSFKKMPSEKPVESETKSLQVAADRPQYCEDFKGEDQNSDTDDDEMMVDGILTSGGKIDYELPSQTELIRQAFAGDDVEGEFEKDKMDVLNKENPEPEKPVLLPGWGQWTDIQQKKGMPAWMLEEHDKAKQKRQDALKKRKDAHLKHVIISEKVDKKTEKLLSKSLPFPYTSKEVFEQSIRMPIGPEFNPVASTRVLNRPAVVKKAGVIIKPIQFEEVDPHDREGETAQSKKHPKAEKVKSLDRGRSVGAKSLKKTKPKKR
ncbi:hypothetical protein H6P81_001797 [Aristolochia fimbriata]|uniref:U3 small nucleolar RNA-associated protein 14 n=1 Tax=Aristolochia fimbriata TaxID=158543 RepID=A0AAV7F8K9_ARIFI|nr:hypothetical protein H6P81_001797 [Aristolochia fimbriata]